MLNKYIHRGLHGYSHENPVKMNLEQQHAILDKTYKDLTKFCGKPPRGNVAPWWEASQEGAELMLKYGVEYGPSPTSREIVLYLLKYRLLTLLQITASPTTTAYPTIYAPVTNGPQSTTANTLSIG